MSPSAGFPHSGILGSQLVCSSPRLIAAYHALHRLSMPRHPPCALLRLISLLLVLILRCDSFPERNHEGHVRTSFHLQLSKSQVKVWERANEYGRHQKPFAPFASE